MGYVYVGRKLCCDVCGDYGRTAGVRRRKCRYGYCPPPAICRACWTPERRSSHREYCEASCRAASERWSALERREAELLASGAFVRRAAIGVGEGRVEVIFRDRDQRKLVIYVSEETYDAIPITEPATPADFAVQGPIVFAGYGEVS